MTEVPEHLLARSRARRSAVGGGGADTPTEASTPATTESDAPAKAAATPAKAEPTPAVPAAPEPTPPWVEAAQQRKKIPFWAVPVLAMLPLWVVIYALTLDAPTPTEPGPLELGAEVYGSCAGCHGASGGGGGAVPGLVGENATPTVFPSPAEQVRWVALGTSGYEAAGVETYGEGAPRTVGANGVMPGWIDSLSAEEVMAVVLHERATLNDEAFDAAVWEEGFEESLAELLPEDRVGEYVAVLEEWAADPPAA